MIENDPGEQKVGSKNQTPTGQTLLESWKEIAAYLQRDVRTAKRWEKTEGLPVHRHLHLSRSSVYAYRNELDSWRARRKPGAEAPRLPVLKWWRPLRSLAYILVLLISLASMGSGPHNRTSVQAADGSGIVLRRIWTGSDVDTMGAPSPNGRYLSFVDWETGDLAIRDLKAEKNRRLTDKGTWKDPAEYANVSRWSPDGKQIAYDWWKENSSDLRIINFENSKSRILFKPKEGEWVTPAGWSPDGKYILACLGRGRNEGNQIVVISVADGAVRSLKNTQGQNASFSPDGQYVVYDRKSREGVAEHDIFALSVEDGRETTLIKHPADDLALGWSPDGNWILFASDRSGPWGIWALGITRGTAHGDPQILKTGGPAITPMGFTRNGSFYYGNSSRNEDVYVARLDPQTGRFMGRPEKVTQRYEGLCSEQGYSPDGKNLAFACSSGPIEGYRGRNILRIRSLETGKDREFLTEFGSIHFPCWFSDNRFLLITGIEENGMGIYKMDTHTGDMKLLLREARVNLLGNEPSPDGKGFFYTLRNREKNLCRILFRNIETGEERELYRAPMAESFLIRLSPDGRWLAFTNRTFQRILRVIPADGGEVRELARFELLGDAPIGFTWTADGRYILFSKPLDSKAEKWDLWRLPLEGGEAQRTGLDMRCGPTSHPDGQQIAFSTVDETKPFNEVWALENFLPALNSQPRK
jgi:Tol biopolymer transport system component